MIAGGRPCNRCIRVDKAESCVAGIPYENGICRKRKKPRSASSTQRASKVLKPSSTYGPKPDESLHCENFRWLSEDKKILNNSPSSSRLCSLLLHKHVHSSSFAHSKTVTKEIYAQKDFRLCDDPMRLLGCFAEDEWDKEMDKEASKSNLTSTTTNNRWSTAMTDSVDSCSFWLCKAGELSRNSDGLYKPSNTTAIFKERLSVEAFATLISSGLNVKDIERMANACIYGEAHHDDQQADKQLPSSSSYDLEHTHGTGLSSLSSHTLPVFKHDKDKVAKTASTITMSIGGEHTHDSSEEEEETNDPIPLSSAATRLGRSSSWQTALCNLRQQSDSKNPPKDLFRLIRKVPVNKYMDIPQLPLQSITHALDTLPPHVTRAISKIGKKFAESENTYILSDTSWIDTQITESLVSWYKGCYDDSIGIGVAGLALERFLRSVFNTPHTERVPLFDDIMGVIAHGFPHPLSHLEQDVEEGLATRIWVNDAMLELLNLDAQGVAQACGMSLVGTGHGGAHLVRDGASVASTQPNNWMHPEILLPRAMANTQAQLLKCSLYHFDGKYLRNIDPEYSSPRSSGYTVFRAREVVHCVRHADGPAFSTTQCFLRPKIDSASTVQGGLLSQGKHMMRRLLGSSFVHR